MQNFLEPLMKLWEIPEIQETARIFFSNQSITVNLIPAFIVAGLALLLLKPLFGIPLLDNILGAMTGGSSVSYGSGISDGYGAPDAGYGAPDAGYGAPDAGYGAPDAGYGAPAPSYSAPAASYSAPASSYDAPASGYDAPTDGYSAGRRKRAAFLPSEASSLYAQINNQLDSQAASFDSIPAISSMSADFVQAVPALN